MKLFEKEVFNGYGVKRISFKKLRFTVGICNRVHIYSSFTYDGLTVFGHNDKGFPFRFEFTFGYVSSPQRCKVYYQGSSVAPHTHFKICLGRLFFGGKTPRLVIAYKEWKQMREFEKMDAAYDAMMESYEN